MAVIKQTKEKKEHVENNDVLITHGEEALTFRKDDPRTQEYLDKKKEDNLKNLHVEKNIFKIGDETIKLKNKKICIKIDAEGHEYEVLQGLKNLLNYNEIFLQVEVFEKNFNKINKYLKSQKFKCINAISNDGKTDYYYKNF